MKLDKKGFMLAEIIIVSAIIVTTVVGLYAGFSNTYKAYETRSSYVDTKTIYSLKEFENFLIDEMILNNITNNYIKIEKENNSFSIKNKDYHNAFLTNFFETYYIEELYLVKYNDNNLDINKAGNSDFIKNIDNDFQDYIKFYLSQLDNPDYDLYDYIILAKTKNDKEKYSALRIKNIKTIN